MVAPLGFSQQPGSPFYFRNADGSGPYDVAADGTLVHANGLGPVGKMLTALDVSAEQPIWTPVAGKRFRVTGIMLTGGVAAGNVVLRDGTAGTIIATLPFGTIGATIITPLGLFSGAADRVLTAQGIATQTLSGMLFGFEEGISGQL